MYHVYDGPRGYRDLDGAAFEAWQAEQRAEQKAFWDRLVWRPITEYDRDAGRAELLRDGPNWAIGFWGPGSRDWCADDDDLRPSWRNAQESMMAHPLCFEPREFAMIEDERRRVDFMADL
ncbi:hypothetical protein [Sphingomonas sp. 1P08PE]|uniref:hypothetical protein n=1 Tax=Sphingomonas sp. 1P08PE TaxID=554122 RepID=UPI0039A1AE12